MSYRPKQTRRFDDLDDRRVVWLQSERRHLRRCTAP
jgi:hypothetical protein